MRASVRGRPGRRQHGGCATRARPWRDCGAGDGRRTTGIASSARLATSVVCESGKPARCSLPRPMPAPALLAISGVAAWSIGFAVGVVGLVAGGFLLKFLAKHRVPWWPALIPPAIAFGPAIGLLCGAYLETGTFESLAFWSREEPARAAPAPTQPAPPPVAPPAPAPSPTPAPTPASAPPAPASPAVVGGHSAARFGWSLLFFFGAMGIYGVVVRFLTSRMVVEELGLKIPEVFV